MIPLVAEHKSLLSKHLILCFAFIVITAAYDKAQAYLVVKPTLSTTNSYDNNPRLRTEDLSNPVVFTRNEVSFNSKYIRPTYEIGIAPKFRFSQYTEETDLNSEEYFVSTFANKLFKRHQIGAAFDFRREATFFTELDDSGIFDINLFRTTLSGQINWSYFVSEKVTLFVNGYMSDVAFEQDPRSRFIDYLSYGTGTSVNYQFSESTSFWAIFNRSGFKTPQISSETESYSLQLGFDHQLTETTYAEFRIGKNRSNLQFKRSQLVLLSINPTVIGNEIFDEEENQSGDITSLMVEKEFSRATLRMNWERRFSPSSQGARQEIEEVSGFLRYRLTELMSLEGRVNYRTRVQEGAISPTRLNDLEVLRYAGSLLYRLSPTLRAELGYKYREQSREGQGAARDSHSIFITLRYRPSEMRFW